MTTAIAVIAAGLTLGTAQTAEAAVVQWGTNSGTAPNYQANVNGDFIMAGNGVLACSATTATTNGTCADLHAGRDARLRPARRALRVLTRRARRARHEERDARLSSS